MKKQIALILLISLLILGCVGTNNSSSTATPSASTGAIQQAEPSGQIENTPMPSRASTPTTMPTAKQVSIKELALGESDFSNSDYSIMDRGERLQSDVDNKSIQMGWKTGYQAKFQKLGKAGLLDYSQIIQTISEYPYENLEKIFQIQKEEIKRNENVTYEELSNPQIGEKSAAWRATSKADSTRAYIIVFYKMNYFETISTFGTATDYELLTELANKAELKIP